MSSLKTNNSGKKNWLMTTDRFVGFIDIMGFKDLVARNSNETIYKMMKRVSDALHFNQEEHGVDYDSDDFETNLFMTTFSDSIMIYSKDTSETCLINFIGAIASMTNDLYKCEIPHKGAVAQGVMTLDFTNSIFFGQPLIDAYLLQEELNFYGIAAHASLENNSRFKDDLAVISYNCPFKNGSANHYAVLPSIFYNDPYEEEPFNELIKSVVSLRAKTSGALRKYIDNTISYLSSENSIRAEWTRKENEMHEARRKELEANPSLKDDLPF